MAKEGWIIIWTIAIVFGLLTRQFFGEVYGVFVSVLVFIVCYEYFRRNIWNKK